jgi:hypothetical protein
MEKNPQNWHQIVLSLSGTQFKPMEQ